MIIVHNTFYPMTIDAQPPKDPPEKAPYVPGAPPPPPPMPTDSVPPQQQASSEQVTVVVPPVGENPYTPKNVVVPAQTPQQTPQSPAPRSGGSFFRRIFIFLILLLVLGGLVYAGRFLLGFLETQKEVTISYWGLWENEELIAPIIADFESQHPNIKVEYVKQSPRQYRERLEAAIARGEGPDAFRFHNTWTPMLARDLAPVPATVMNAAQFSATFYPVASTNLVAGQTIYGLPLMIEGLGLYYNEDLFTAAGVTTPTTWEEMVTVVPKLTVRSEDSIITSAVALGTTGNVEHFSDIVAIMMMQNGVNLQNPTGKFAEDTLLFYRGFANPSNPLYTWSDAMDNSISAFANGRVAMIFAPSWRAFDVRQINPDLRFRIAPIPQLPGNTVSWASYWVEGVSVKSEFQSQAWEFLGYLTGKEAATKLYTEEAKTRLFGEPYARMDLGASLLNDPLVGAYIKQASDARSFPLASRTFDNGLNDRLIKYMEDAINSVGQGMSPQEALSTVASGFAQVLGSYGLTSATTNQ
jgi:multiple sugar transport system substrate-binding protein